MYMPCIATTYGEWFVWVDNKLFVCYGNFYIFVCNEPLNCSAATFFSRDLPTCNLANQEERVRLRDIYKHHAVQSCRALWDMITFTYKSKVHHILYTYTYPQVYFYSWEEFKRRRKLGPHYAHMYFQVIFLQLRSLCTYEKLDTRYNIQTYTFKLIFYSWEEFMHGWKTLRRNSVTFGTLLNFIKKQTLKLKFTQYPAIHTNYSWSNCHISN